MLSERQRGGSVNRRVVALVAVGAVFIAAGLTNQADPLAASRPASTGFVNWPGYLYSASHSSASPATAITPTTVAHLRRKWTFKSPGGTVSGQPGGKFTSSPTIYNGIVYIGSNNGTFYALNETTGTLVWSQPLGWVPKLTCGGALGISSTATIAIDPATSLPTVYVSGGNGYLFALNAATGSIVWQSVVALQSPTQNDYYNWSSPTIANGLVYLGVASQCDLPLVPNAGLDAFDMSTGALTATYRTMAAGVQGGSIWSSAAVDAAGEAFVTTGNDVKGSTTPGDSSSIVALTGTSLNRDSGWRIPNGSQVGDDDWASSPTVFQATLSGVPTEMVGACNKNGFFYAMNAASLSAGPVWSYKVGAGTPSGAQSCLGATIWDGADLYQPGNATTINGTNYPGSVRELDPSTGTAIWQTGLNGVVIGSPAKDAAGVIAASTYSPSANTGTYLINAANGSILRFIKLGAEFAQPVFADNYLFLATHSNGVLSAYGV
jgi:outer membrane protein assembly factor BamB